MTDFEGEGKVRVTLRFRAWGSGWVGEWWTIAEMGTQEKEQVQKGRGVYGHITLNAPHPI